MATTGRPTWRTSTYTDNGATCVEVAPGPRAVLLRDTKDHGTGPILLLNHPEWAQFRHAVLAGLVGPVAGVTITRCDEQTRHTAGTKLVTNWHVTRDGHTLHFTDAEWTAFTAGTRDGEFDFAPSAL